MVGGVYFWVKFSENFVHFPIIYVIKLQLLNLSCFISQNTFTYFICNKGTSEACLGVLRIQDICHFTSRDIGYYPFYFQGYGKLGSIFSLLPGILKI